MNFDNFDFKVPEDLAWIVLLLPLVAAVLIAVLPSATAG